MTSPGPGTDAQAARRPLSIVILGADAVLAAAPATPVQLVHACLRAGYDAVVPPSWGDELVATTVLHELQKRAPSPVVQCSCPLAARRLLAAGAELRPFLLSVVSPPVAAARYLRALHAASRLRITYAGRCPGAADDDIDARITPEELLAVFEDRRVSLGDQPTLFDEIIPPDRRRFRSLPGGVPRPEVLRALAGRQLVEVEGDALSIELTQLLLTGGSVLVDVGPALGCVCTGRCAGSELSSADARARVAASEPPLATGPVLDESIAVALLEPLTGPARAHVVPEIATALPVTPAADLRAANEAPPLAPMVPAETAVAAERLGARQPLPADSGAQGPRRRSPAQGVRALASTTPTARDADGRQLPRAYIALRRSSPRRLRACTTEIPPVAPDAPDALSNGTRGAADGAVPTPRSNGAAAADAAPEASRPSNPAPRDEGRRGEDMSEVGVVLSMIGGTLDALINRLMP